MDGLTAMEAFGRQMGGAPIIVITAFGDLATAVDAINKGAFEYVVKPFDVAEIRAAIERALRIEPTKAATAGNNALDGMLGRTPAMQNVFKKIALAANSDAAVLLHGESGVGKELAATAIHRNSGRRHGPFVAVNFAALEPATAEAGAIWPGRGRVRRRRAGAARSAASSPWRNVVHRRGGRYSTATATEVAPRAGPRRSAARGGRFAVAVAVSRDLGHAA